MSPCEQDTHSFELVTHLADDESGNRIVVAVTYFVTGRYRPATWGYFGGEPAEYPELEVVSVVVVEDSALGGMEAGWELDPDELAGGHDAVERRAWAAAESLGDC